MPYEAITLDQKGGVATLTLNRPEALNALNIAMPNVTELASNIIVCANALLRLNSSFGPGPPAVPCICVT